VTRPFARQIVEVARGLEASFATPRSMPRGGHRRPAAHRHRALQLADAGTDEHGERSFRTVTQFSMQPIEEIGMLKMDLLGLRTST